MQLQATYRLGSAVKDPTFMASLSLEAEFVDRFHSECTVWFADTDI